MLLLSTVLFTLVQLGSTTHHHHFQRLSACARELHNAAGTVGVVTLLPSSISSHFSVVFSATATSSSVEVLLKESPEGVVTHGKLAHADEYAPLSCEPIPQLPLPANLIAFNSTRGAALLRDERTELSNSFFGGMMAYTTQITQTLCAVATATVILNGLNVQPAVVDPSYTPYPYFTQGAFFTECVNQYVSRPAVTSHGMTLPDFDKTVNCFAHTAAVHASTTNTAGFRLAAATALAEGHGVAINFHRVELGQLGGGHFSPVVAFNPTSDTFLVLDVSRYKYPAYWATADDLFAAMNTTDSSTGLSRGYAVVQIK